MELIMNLIIIIIGLVIGMTFGFLIFKQYIYKGPDSNIVSKEIYTDSDGKKFKWIPKVCICPVNLSMDKLKNPNYVVSGH